MKINWGTGIVLAFIGFISFIMYFVISMNVDDKYDHDLVTEDYYKEELAYQENIEKIKNSKSLKNNITWKRTDEGLEITFPENLSNEDIQGNVFLYRPSNKQLDFETIISLSNHHLLIPDKRLLAGRWDIKIDWQYKNTPYLFIEKITY